MPERTFFFKPHPHPPAICFQMNALSRWIFLLCCGALPHAAAQTNIVDVVEYPLGKYVESSPEIEAEPSFEHACLIAKRPELSDDIVRLIDDKSTLDIQKLEENVYQIQYGKEFSGTMTLEYEKIADTHVQQIFSIEGTQHTGGAERGKYHLLLDYRVMKKGDASEVLVTVYVKPVGQPFVSLYAKIRPSAVRKFIDPKIRTLIGSLTDTVEHLRKDPEKLHQLFKEN
jgi:hypothetical protein